MRREPFDNAELLQHAHDFVVEVYRARQWINLDVTLEHQHAMSGAAEQVRSTAPVGPAPTTMQSNFIDMASPQRRI